MIGLGRAAVVVHADGGADIAGNVRRGDLIVAGIGVVVPVGAVPSAVETVHLLIRNRNAGAVDRGVIDKTRGLHLEDLLVSQVAERNRVNKPIIHADADEGVDVVGVAVEADILGCRGSVKDAVHAGVVVADHPFDDLIDRLSGDYRRIVCVTDAGKRRHASRSRGRCAKGQRDHCQSREPFAEIYHFLLLNIVIPP